MREHTTEDRPRLSICTVGGFPVRDMVQTECSVCRCIVQRQVCVGGVAEIGGEKIFQWRRQDSDVLGAMKRPLNRRHRTASVRPCRARKHRRLSILRVTHSCSRAVRRRSTKPSYFDLQCVRTRTTLHVNSQNRTITRKALESCLKR